MRFDDFQEQAGQTAHMTPQQTDARIELVLGLTTEAGSVASIFRRFLREGTSLESRKEQLKQELGDVLWYVSMIAKSLDLKLSEVATYNLVRTSDRYNLVEIKGDAQRLPDLDGDFPIKERFPTQMVFHFTEMTNEDGSRTVCTKILDAEPNMFPDGAEVFNDKKIGFDLDVPIGNRVNDNAIIEDGYRYHDSIHIAFMAVLGWSPVMRALLRLKRKSNENTDMVEDGARARDLDEALSATLAAMSLDRNNFQSERDIDGDVRDMIRRIVTHLECNKLPLWLWAQAIHQGYLAMNQLRRNGGGYLFVNRDTRTVKYSQSRPKIIRQNNAS